MTKRQTLGIATAALAIAGGGLVLKDKLSTPTTNAGACVSSEGECYSVLHFVGGRCPKGWTPVVSCDDLTPVPPTPSPIPTQPIPPTPPPIPTLPVPPISGGCFGCAGSVNFICNEEGCILLIDGEIRQRWGPYPPGTKTDWQTQFSWNGLFISGGR